jgi:hypothetical protein
MTARVTKSRKQTKERKNRSMKVRGVKKVRHGPSCPPQDPREG